MRNIPTLVEEVSLLDIFVVVDIVLLVDILVSEPSLLLPGPQWSTDVELKWFSF